MCWPASNSVSGVKDQVPSGPTDTTAVMIFEWRVRWILEPGGAIPEMKGVGFLGEVGWVWSLVILV